MNTYKIIATLGILLGVVAIGIGIASNNNATTNTAPALLASAVSVTDHAKGNSASALTLVEYSDFQCPACGAYYPLVKQITQEFGEKIHFVYRHFPLQNLHAHAKLAAQAAEAAGLQGKFWEMHDQLFENQKYWSDAENAESVFIGYAGSLGLDIAQFTKDLNTNEVQERVNADYESGISSGVNGTPTFFLNGTKLENPQSYDAFKSLIQNALDGNS